MSEKFYNTLSGKEESKKDWINFMTNYTGLPKKEIELYYDLYIKAEIFKKV